MKKKESDLGYFPVGDFKYWFAQYVFSSAALKFYHEHGRFPTKFSKRSINVRGNKVSMVVM